MIPAGGDIAVTDDPKLLAEWFLTDRWSGSSAFLLPMEPRGLYREMLTQAWRRGGALPNDPEAIQRATGCTASEWRRCWPRISRYWTADGDTLVNATQLEVLAESRRKAEAAAARGRAGAAAKHAREHFRKDSTSTAQACAQAHAQAEPEDVLADCSLSLSDGFPAHTDARALPLATGEDVVKESSEITELPQKARARDEGGRDTWITPYIDAYRARWGQDCEPVLGKWFGPLSKAEAKLGAPEALLRWRRYVASRNGAEWVSPSKFMETLGEWTADRPPATQAHSGRPMSAAEKTVAAVQEVSAEDDDMERRRLLGEAS